MIVLLAMLGTFGLLLGGAGVYGGLTFFQYGGFLLTGLVSLGTATIKNWYDQKELRLLRSLLKENRK